MRAQCYGTCGYRDRMDIQLNTFCRLHTQRSFALPAPNTSGGHTRPLTLLHTLPHQAYGAAFTTAGNTAYKHYPYPSRPT